VSVLAGESQKRRWRTNNPGAKKRAGGEAGIADEGDETVIRAKSGHHRDEDRRA